jgi:hypothetical protein
MGRCRHGNKRKHADGVSVRIFWINALFSVINEQAFLSPLARGRSAFGIF